MNIQKQETETKKAPDQFIRNRDGKKLSRKDMGKMKVTTDERGFQLINHPSHLHEHLTPRLVGCSSAINFRTAERVLVMGTSYLWVGEFHHLNREEVKELVEHLNRWLTEGKL